MNTNQINTTLHKDNIIALSNTRSPRNGTPRVSDDLRGESRASSGNRRQEGTQPPPPDLRTELMGRIREVVLPLDCTQPPSPRLKIGTWNIGGQHRKKKEIAEQMLNADVHVLFLQETKEKEGDNLYEIKELYGLE